MRHKRAYRYRCSPTPAHGAVLARTFGCTRSIDTWALRLRPDAYYQRHERIGYVDRSASLTLLQPQPAPVWLTEVSSVPLQQALRHLDSAFRTRFEGRATSPTCKKKRGKQSAPDAPTAFSWDAATRMLTRAKMEPPRAMCWSRACAGTPTTVTVSRARAGRSLVSFLVDEEIAAVPRCAAAVGGDVGVKDRAALRTGEQLANPQQLARSAPRLTRAPQALCRKQQGSKNREKARRSVARSHATSADQRLEGLHKLTTRLIHENHVICVERLAVKHMIRKHTLATAIRDAGWGELVRHLAYKAAW